MASFKATITAGGTPTPFGIFDTEKDFQMDADSMVTFVKRKLGDDILSVELTNKQIWMSFEEATLEYSRVVNEYQAKSQLGNLLGNSLNIPDNEDDEYNGGPQGDENKFPRETLEFLMRKAEPYASHAAVGGAYNIYSGSIDLVDGQQDYDIYETMKFHDPADGVLKRAMDVFHDQKLRIFEVQHYSPQAAYRFFDTTSAINYLNNEFAFESFTPETVFYVLPVFEDLLRAGQMDISNRVRRSNYSYELIGKNLRIFPRPTVNTAGKKMFIRFGKATDGVAPDIPDSSIEGVSGLHNLPWNNISYNGINSIGRQWIRQYTYALSKEVLGLVRSKFGSVPIPSGDLQLNGSDLLSQAQSEKEKLMTNLKEMLDSMTYDKLLEGQAAEVGNMQTILKAVPIPLGKVITIG